MIFFDDSDAVAVQYAPALPRTGARTIAGRLAAGAGAATLMLAAVAAAAALTAALIWTA